jgi:hypothetical protein
MKFIFSVLFLMLMHNQYGYAEKFAPIASSCGEWVKVRQNGSEKVTLYWFDGFISAYNKYEYTGKHPQGVLKNIGQKNISSWLDKYCLSNTGDTLQGAVESLIDEKKPIVKACAFKKSSGRPCIPYEEKMDEQEQKTVIPKKNNWKFWEQMLN